MAANSYYNSHPASVPLDDKEAHQHLLSPEISYSSTPSLHEHPAHKPQPLYDSGDLANHQYQQQSLLPSPGLSPGIHSGPSSGQASPLKPFMQSSAGHSRTNSGKLKPFHLKANMDHTHHAHVQQNTAYHGATDASVDFEQLKAIKKEDIKLKARIRRLRIVTRVLAFLISIAVFIPIALTLHKYLTTRHVFREVVSPAGTAVSRTAWAKDSKTWPTYMYFAVALVSLVLNFIIIFSYKFGVKYANKAAVVATTFSWIVMAGNLVVWCVAASLYRTEKDKGGKSNDLWGWTCSPAAKKIQKEFANEVDFDRFCNVQSISWYIGLVQVAASALTIVTYVMVYMRRKAKKNLKKQASLMGGFEAKGGH